MKIHSLKVHGGISNTKEKDGTGTEVFAKRSKFNNIAMQISQKA